jgi:DNA-directed RNA polymerase specialized sigma24 family protein
LGTEPLAPLASPLRAALASGMHDAPLDDAFSRAYDELRDLARAQLGRHGSTPTVNTTVLVHEAYLKLSARQDLQPKDRAHFFALAARAMRFVLVDHARSRLAAKRDGGAVTFDEALEQLERSSPRLAQVVHLRFFAGLSHVEIAEILEVSEPTVKRDWARARAWLHHFMAGD